MTENVEPRVPSAAGEVPLVGGRVTSGVVRVGDTVRRPVTEASSFVAELLGHLERRGFAGAPRHLGSDGLGRDVFSYVPGWVPARFRRWSDRQVAAAGALLRAFHDATRDCGLVGRHSVICHNDPGPNNAVFSASGGGLVPVGLIDFDTAAPGEPLEDLGYMAWTWCVSSKYAGVSEGAVSGVGRQAAQVRLLADAYGLDAVSRAGLVDALVDRQERNARWWRSRLTGADDAGARRRTVERIDWSERERAFTVAHREVFAAALR
ncbi:aminoglycoside phosphotransferase family protein [Streptomyces lincolnensis]|uniref:phosphotransferase family protein n=1 Tax=Streptomyces lincolnensis TaxID=1915 RepID=UPI001E3FB61F|nr:phosphotransferase [Streptomyces lincolnensis]MCD7440084.1 aminoglycoside phosphotransferase family protein [Streptomyces lincolnensis]